MNKEEIIANYGIAAYENMQAHSKGWKDAHPEEVAASNAVSNPEICRKGGKYYNKHLVDVRTGLQGERNTIRKKHAHKWRRVKRIIAPGSQIHHEWIPGTAKYRGVALVEADQHMDGGIDVIHILEGNITLLTEKEVRDQERQ